MNFVWFNDDVRLSIASVSIPFGQRFITIDLAAADRLAFEFPNLYLETIVDVQGSGTATAVTAPYQRVVSYSPIFQKGTIQGLDIDRMELYVNNIFVNPEVNVQC